MSLKNLFLETRPQFLILSPILVFLGMAMALYNGNFNLGYFLLSIVGLVLLHISVNTLNDYDDFMSGIDMNTKRTMFSGGTGILPKGLLTPEAVFKLGLGAFVLAVPIAIYFLLVRGFYLLPLFIIGGILVLFYTNFFTKIGLGSAEASAGLGLGTLPVFGTFLILNGHFEWAALYASVPSGFLVANLLFLNEFPDEPADRVGKRKTLPITRGHKKAAMIYSSLVILTYLWVAVGVILKLMPAWSLLALLTLPFGLKAIKGSLTFKSFGELIPAQGANVMAVLLTQLFMGIGYLIAHFAA